MNDREDILRARVPGYRDIVEQLELLATVKPPRHIDSTVTPASLVKAGVLESIAVGKAPTEKQLHDSGRRAITEVMAAQAASVGLIEARRDLEGRRDELANRHRGVILEALNEELEDLVEEARKLEPLADIADPDSAITARRVDDYECLKDIRTRYTTLRAAQVKEHRNQHGGDLGGRRVHALLLFVRSPLDVFPAYFEWKNAGSVVPPWPVTDEGSGGIEQVQPSGRRTLIQDCSSATFFEWSLTHNVALWAPTPSEFADAGAKLDKLELERHERAAGGNPTPSAAGPKVIR
jgi:hypothetical protein